MVIFQGIETWGVDPAIEKEVARTKQPLLLTFYWLKDADKFKEYQARFQRYVEIKKRGK